MNIVIRRKEETSVTYEQIVDLIHESFKERLEQGLRFTCSFMGVDEYKRKTEHSIIIVAILDETEELVGTASVQIQQDNRGRIYGYNEFVAVKPDKKRLGIGKKTEEAIISIAQTHNCNYIISDTAVGAKSSIKWHKKNGYKIVGLKSWDTTNYYSFVFRRQLVPINVAERITIFKNAFCSFAKTLLARKKNGNHRKWVEYYSRWNHRNG